MAAAMATPMPRAVKGWTAKSLLRADMNACAAAQDARTALALVGSVLDQGLHLDPHLVTVAFNLIADRLEEEDTAPRVPAGDAARRAAGVLLAKSRGRSPGTYSDAVEAAAADPRLIEEAPARFVVRTLREHGVPAAGDADAMMALLPVPAPLPAPAKAEGKGDAAKDEAAKARDAAKATLPEASVEGARAVYHRCAALTGTSAWEGVVSMFVRVCSRSGRPMEGWKALTDARRAGLKPKLRAFSSLLEALAPAQAADVCTKLRCEIKGCGLACGQHEYALLVQALGPASMRDPKAVARIARAGEAEAAGIRPVAALPPSPAAPAPAPPTQDAAASPAAAAPATATPHAEGAPAPAAPDTATPHSVNSPASSVSARSARADPPPPLDSAARPAEHRWSSAPVLALLAELMEDIYAPEEELQGQLRRLFESGPMRRRRWRVGRATVGPNGVCPLNGGRLRSLDLSDEEMTQLARQTVELATRTPHRLRSFDAFQHYLLQHGPWDVLIDGANVGFFNQNYAGGMFSHPQIDDVVRHFEEEGRRPLLILHERWFGDSVDLREHRRGGYKRRRKETSRSGKRPRAAFDTASKPHATAAEASLQSSASSSRGAGRSKASVSSDEDHGGAEGAADEADEDDEDDEDDLLSDSDDPEAGAYAAMRRCLARWRDKPNLVFQVPRGNNDDWYWLYAAGTATPQPASAALSTAAVHADSDTEEPAAYMSDVSARDATSLMRPPPAVRRQPAGPAAGAAPAPSSSSAAAAATAPVSGGAAHAGGLPAAAAAAASSGIDLTSLPGSRSGSASGLSARGGSTAAVEGGPFVAPRALRPGHAGDRPASASPAAATAPGSPPAGDQRPALALAVRRRRSDSFSRSSRMSAGSASPMSFASSEMERMPVGPGAAGSSTHASRHGRVFVVSNDQMRDHHFQMLAPQNFLKWRERHQVAFHFQDVGRGGAGGGPQRQLHFRFPSIFSHRTQPALEGRAWYFPVGGTAGQWLCCWKEA
ncbi:hypothetical protein FNF27_07786 [Cafeteria roenbergensis]|uniref:ribonuclease P n=1 Tax=Cafeteria roenbergensis TaxID=33653 RepID=A0A5A8DL39_CAFRO|nr:hypothetical protein FNF27_07786 [Cafeteria roenbergensis]